MCPVNIAIVDPVAPPAKPPVNGNHRSRRKPSAYVALLADVDRQVEELFFRIHDRNNPLHAEAYRLHVDATKRSRRNTRSHKRVATITEPSVLKAIVKYRVLDACENLAILERHAAQARLEEARRHVITQYGLRTGRFLDDDESISPDRLLVVRKNKAEELTELKSLLTFCRGLGEDPEEFPVEDLCNGVVPKEFERRPDFQAFLSDLGTLFAQEGTTARELVSRVCEDEGFARKVADDEELPKPLRYLATVSLKIQSLSLKKKENEKAVGFSLADN